MIFPVFGYDFSYGNIIFFCKFKIPAVVSRYSHNCTGSIFKQNIVCDPDGYFFTIKWIYDKPSCETADFFYLC